MSVSSRWLILRGELFSSIFTSALTSVIRLISSLILTRLLSPEAYGVFSILLSIMFMIELVSEVGTGPLIIRHARGADPRFVHTLWTIRLIRNGINFLLMYGSAPLVADIYSVPVLVESLRMFSVFFLISGFESMSFLLAQRDQKSRIWNYVEMSSNAVMTVSVIGLAHLLHNQNALIYGLLLHRAILTLASHLFYRHIGVGFALDKEARTEIFKFSRVVIPSSLLTIVLSQYDKIVFLKLFDLRLLGVYGVAASIIAPVTGLLSKNCRSILYSRCAEYFRSDAKNARSRYYGENVRLLTIGTVLPAIVAGLAPLAVAILYDTRYSGAGVMLIALALGVVVASFQEASENLLVAAGRTRVVLISNLVRLCTIVPFTLLGNYLFGFQGFLWFTLGSHLAVLAYCYSVQHKMALFEWRPEAKRFALAVVVFLACWALGSLILHLVPTGLLHLGSKRA